MEVIINNDNIMKHYESWRENNKTVLHPLTVFLETMGFKYEIKTYVCNNKEADILKNLIYSLSPDYPKGSYTSYIPTMFIIYKNVLMDRIGLHFLENEYKAGIEARYTFSILDEKKFLLIRLKYGI